MQAGSATGSKARTLDGCLDGLAGCLTSAGLMALFLALGLGLMYWGWNVLGNARESVGWPTAPGMVVSAELDHSENTEGGDSWSPEISYRYLAANQERTSYAIKFGENSYSDRDDAEEILARYPVGQPVLVYYDPADPERSVLEPGVTAGSYIILGTGGLFVVITVLVGIVGMINVLFRRGG